MASKTYICGAAGIVRRLDDLTSPWISISPPTTTILTDIKTDPNDSDKVFVVGQGNKIYVSSDAGVTWVVPGGNHSSVSINYFEVWPVSSSVIYAVGSSGYVVKSTDGGLTFNLTLSFPTPSGLPEQNNATAVHFIDDVTGIVAYEQSIFKTTNGGITWLYLNGGFGIFPVNITVFGGVHISADEQVIVGVADTNIVRSTDGGNTFTIVHNFPPYAGIHLTWIDDNTMWATGHGNYRVKSIDAGATWSIISAYSASGPSGYGAHFYNSTSGFYTTNGTAFHTTDSGSTGAASIAAPVIFLAVWTRQTRNICYILSDCNGQLADIHTSQDLSSYSGIVTIEGYNTCWAIAVDSNPNARCLDAGVVVVNVYQDCDQCNSPCFQLTNCADDEEIIITNTDLSAYIGEVIKIAECGGKCWEVSSSSNCDTVITVTVVDNFTTCELCAPEEEPEEPVLPRREYTPGISSFNCSPEKIKEINCTFANEVYKEVKKLRYGISSCCDGNYEEALIAKKLLDLQLIKDEDACKPVETPACCAPCNLSSSLIVFRIVS